MTHKPFRITRLKVWVVTANAGDLIAYLSESEARSFADGHMKLTAQRCNVEERMATLKFPKTPKAALKSA